MASTTNSTPHPQLPKLNGRNYYHWSIQMKVLFESQDLWDVVKEGYEEPEDLDEVTDEEESDLKEIKKRDRKALFMIYQAVDEVIFERISSSATSKEAWDMLYKTYRGEDKVKVVRLQTLRCEFDGIKMRDSETVEDFYNRVILLLNQLRLNGETIEDTRVVEKILRSLTRRFEYIVVAIEESKDLSTLSLESLLGTLQSHELRMKQFDSPTYEQAFQFQSSNAHENSKEIAKHDQNDDRGKGKAKSLSQVQCHYCQNFGHVKKFCRKRIADEKGTTFMHKEEGNDDDTMFMILSTQDAQFNDMWYIDSGCSNHMCGNKDLFTQIDDSLKREVRTGDDKKLDVYGIGEIIINTKQGNKRIQNVYYVPELKHNLLSVGQLLQKNYELHFKENSCMIKDPKGNMLGKISMSSNKMFPLNFKENNLFAFNLYTNKTSLLWHHRFGHTNMDISVICTNTVWSKEYQMSLNLKAYMKDACLENKPENRFHKIKHGEPLNNSNSSTRMDVAFEEEKCWDNSMIQEENHPQILQDDNSDDTRQIHEDSPISTPSTVQTPSPSSDNRIPQNSQSTMSTPETPPRKSYRNLNRIYANSLVQNCTLVTPKKCDHMRLVTIFFSTESVAIGFAILGVIWSLYNIVSGIAFEVESFFLLCPPAPQDPQTAA
ncbi:hypothetical protein L2E82_38127 [Cichorium intybus]|uniref:Uncharacterized protein n=1 Tax=Cichorium intybus TaxID=13427 RepID=A0ACB9AFJ6_CICIN|nr:hypothetical protein L2E82_38127 [Cichorium intybus]